YALDGRRKTYEISEDLSFRDDCAAWGERRSGRDGLEAPPPQQRRRRRDRALRSVDRSRRSRAPADKSSRAWNSDSYGPRHRCGRGLLAKGKKVRQAAGDLKRRPTLTVRDYA